MIGVRQVAELTLRVWIKKDTFSKLSNFDKDNLKEKIKQAVSDSRCVLELEEQFRDYGLPITCNSDDSDITFTL